MNITSAIQNKQIITFSYDGFFRVVEPHTYGKDKKGHEALRAYQVSGGSESGENFGWKLFHVGEIRNLSVLPTHFATARPKYRRGDSVFSTIHAQL